MIQVQIASQITPLGVQGVRWVLVDPTDSCNATVPTPVDMLTAAVAPVEPSAERSLLSMGVLKLGVTGMGLGLALWTAQAWLGAPTAPGLGPTAGQRATERAAVLPPVLAAPAPAPTLPAATQPAPTLPPDRAAPAATVEPAASAPAAAPLITAELR